MTKWIFLLAIIFAIWGFLVWKFSSYTPISEQIDLKTMNLTNPNYYYSTRSFCDTSLGACQNYSSSSSPSSSSSGWGGGSSSGK